MGEMGNAYKMLVGNTHGKRPFGESLVDEKEEIGYRQYSSV
jgi:hypothetical protein